MWLRNFGQIILIIASISATSNEPENCVYFEKESGFVQLLPTPVFNNTSIISLELKAYNCDSISLTIHNGKDYILTVKNEDMFDVDDGNVDNFEVSSSCNGLWHNVELQLTEQQPILYFDSTSSYQYVDGYDLNAFLQAFRDEPLYVRISNNSSHGTKPFEGFIRNIRFNNRVQSIDEHRLNGTLSVKACPSDLTFPSDSGAVRFRENVTFNDNLRILFELKIEDCSECCSTSAVLLSAIAEDSHLIMEIVEKHLYVKMKSQDRENILKLSPIFDYDLCDGNWHKIALLQQGADIRVIADGSSYSNNYAINLNFSAPLYIGLHPTFKLLSAVDIRNGFKGRLRSLHINGAVPEIV